MGKTDQVNASGNKADEREEAGTASLARIGGFGVAVFIVSSLVTLLIRVDVNFSDLKRFFFVLVALFVVCVLTYLFTKEGSEHFRLRGVVISVCLCVFGVFTVLALMWKFPQELQGIADLGVRLVYRYTPGPTEFSDDLVCSTSGAPRADWCTSAEKRCPDGLVLKSATVVCALETASGGNRFGPPPTQKDGSLFITVIEPSDNVDDGRCQVIVDRGEPQYANLRGTRQYNIESRSSMIQARCRERDKNGYDCELRGRFTCGLP